MAHTVPVLPDQIHTLLEQVPPARKLRVNAKAPISEYILDSMLSAMGIDRDQVDEHINYLSVKVREKARNMINFLEHGTELSIFTKIGFKELVTETLVNGDDFAYSLMHYPPRKYPFEITYPQSKQLAALFPVLTSEELRCI